MRKNSPRKWIHAILDLLPLFVIPVFAIYSRNENAQFGYEVTQEVNKAVDFNQKIENGNMDNNVQDWSIWRLNYEYDTSGILFTRSTENYGVVYQDPIIPNNHICILRFNYVCNDMHVYYGNNRLTTSSLTTSGLVEYRFTTNGTRLGFYAYALNMRLSGINIYDLTQMFGEGNEPTIQDFDTWFNGYYPYTDSQNYVIENYETITYNDTDIGSQMIYTLYHTVDKYFNMNKVFNMGAIWNWVNNTMFGSGAPLSAYIVYQVIAYEFIVDLIFLLYSVFMFIIDFADKMITSFMEKPLRR